MEVCPLSRGVIFQLLSSSLQRSLRFLHYSFTCTSIRNLLQDSLPTKGKRYRLTVFFLHDLMNNLGSTFPPVILYLRIACMQHNILITSLLGEPVSIFGSLTVTVFNSSSLNVSLVALT